MMRKCTTCNTYSRLIMNQAKGIERKKTNKNEEKKKNAAEKSQSQ